MLPPKTLHKYTVEEYFVIDSISKSKPGGNEEVEGTEIGVTSVHLGDERDLNNSFHEE